MFKNKRKPMVVIISILLLITIGAYAFAQTPSMSAKLQLYRNLQAEWDREHQALLHMSGKTKTDAELMALRQRADAHKKQAQEIARLQIEVEPQTPEQIFEKKLGAADTVVSMDMSFPSNSKEKLALKSQRIAQLYQNYKAGKISVVAAQMELDEIKKMPIK